MIFGGFDLRLANDAIVSTSHALNPILRFKGGERKLLEDEVGVAPWS